MLCSPSYSFSQEVTSEVAFSMHISSISHSTLILFFHSPWAAPHVQMHTILEMLVLMKYFSLNDPNILPQISFVLISAEEPSSISEQYDVTAMPFMILHKEGRMRTFLALLCSRCVVQLSGSLN